MVATLPTTSKTKLVTPGNVSPKRITAKSPLFLSWGKLSGKLQRFGWGWKCLQNALAENDWFVPVWNGGVHDWGISVPLHQIIVALLGLAPFSDHGLSVDHFTSEALQCSLGSCGVGEVHNGIPKDGHVAEIGWQIQEVIALGKAGIVEEIHQL